MSTTIVEIESRRPASGFPTVARTLSATRFGAGGGELGCQVTISGDTREAHQYVLLDERRARELQDAIDVIYGPRDAAGRAQGQSLVEIAEAGDER